MTNCPDPLNTFLAFLSEMQLDAAAREAAYVAWLAEAGPRFAAEMTEELIPADLRAAGIRFEWTAAR